MNAPRQWAVNIVCFVTATDADEAALYVERTLAGVIDHELDPDRPDDNPRPWAVDRDDERPAGRTRQTRCAQPTTG